MDNVLSIERREPNVSEIDNLFYASFIVSMLLFPTLHMYNFAKDNQNFKQKPEAPTLH